LTKVCGVVRYKHQLKSLSTLNDVVLKKRTASREILMCTNVAKISHNLASCHQHIRFYRIPTVDTPMRIKIKNQR